MRHYLLSVLVLLLLLTGCNHKDLCYESLHLVKVRVAYDWLNAPEASVGGMRVFFYSEDDPTDYYFFDLPGMSGGYVELPAGKYRILSYNNDTKTALFTNIADFYKHYCYTREGNILEPIYGNGMSLPSRADDDERIVITPDQVYLCRDNDVTVRETGSYYTFAPNARQQEDEPVTTDVQVITLYPEDALCHYSYEVRNVKNIEHISQVSAALSGMAPSLLLCDESLAEEPITLPVAGAVTTMTRASDREITGSFLTFGHNTAANGARHKMSFYVVMDDGSKYQFNNSDKFDVTDQVVNAPDRRHVHIIIDDLEIPDPKPSDGGGFNPNVDDWGSEEHEIDI